MQIEKGVRPVVMTPTLLVQQQTPAYNFFRNFSQKALAGLEIKS